MSARIRVFPKRSPVTVVSGPVDGATLAIEASSEDR
jgi:hypothetical protein